MNNENDGISNSAVYRIPVEGGSGEVAEKASSYRDLDVWRRGLDLAKTIYLATCCFPGGEQFGLVSQMRRAAVSVPSNIAEGQARKGPGDFLRFLYIAKGSLAELDTQALLSMELGFLTREQHAQIATEIDVLQRMLYALISSLGGSK